MMANATTLAVALHGLEGTIVQVEADVSPGLPAFALVGMPDSSILQARDRVRAAMAHCGVPLASRRITINLVPAWMPKSGTAFDLAMAVAILAAQQRIPAAALESIHRTVHCGELGLDGSVRAVPGVLPALRAVRDAGTHRAVVPAENEAEARLVEGLEIYPVRNLRDVLSLYGAGASGRYASQQGSRSESQQFRIHPAAGDARPPEAHPLDFADVWGHSAALRAAEVAAAGGHHMLLTGPPGTGKTMIATRLPSIMPPLSDEDALTVSAISSLTGAFDARHGLRRHAPFEAPHHTASAAAIVGGGSGLALPGAITRAHAGVLFLDEAPEFSARVLETLREPLENGEVVLHRSRGTTRYPARFQLVMAANPCPCGHAWGDGANCSCTPMQRRRYFSRLSGPLLDRVDVRVDVPPPPRTRQPHQTVHTSREMAARVAEARERARRRYEGLPFSLNARIPAPLLRTSFSIPAARLLDEAVRAGRLSLRGRDRVLRIAWTLADLDGSAHPTENHVGEALMLRQEDHS